ncbi:hypothetical protein PoB_001587800 [Plakobranchus ocellatus]|uniref:Uncharacterized protein n=1 Tax=Plakobranchus ocellatus TaxID=259542 RepID=A0AAV3Z3Q3_9GAST|nr:hypothetical protein PoB_001587800 [Plakobranchus ocellatus]
MATGEEMLTPVQDRSITRPRSAELRACQPTPAILHRSCQLTLALLCSWCLRLINYTSHILQAIFPFIELLPTQSTQYRGKHATEWKRASGFPYVNLLDQGSGRGGHNTVIGRSRRRGRSGCAAAGRGQKSKANVTHRASGQEVDLAVRQICGVTTC